jgi:hypothetical protein
MPCPPGRDSIAGTSFSTPTTIDGSRTHGIDWISRTGVVRRSAGRDRGRRFIARVAAEEPGTLILMGLRERGMLTPSPGSTAYRVLWLTSAPVLILPNACLSASRPGGDAHRRVSHRVTTSPVHAAGERSHRGLTPTPCVFTCVPYSWGVASRCHAPSTAGRRAGRSDTARPLRGGAAATGGGRAPHTWAYVRDSPHP